MSDDVRKLMRAAGWADGAYQEVVAERGASEVASAWPLLAAVNGRLAAGPIAGGGSGTGGDKAGR